MLLLLWQPKTCSYTTLCVCLCVCVCVCACVFVCEWVHIYLVFMCVCVCVSVCACVPIFLSGVCVSESVCECPYLLFVCMWYRLKKHNHATEYPSSPRWSATVSKGIDFGHTHTHT